MKKLLLTFALIVAMVLGVSAQTVVECKSLTVPGTTTVSGYTFDIQKNNGSTAPALRNDGSIRLYAKGTLTVSGTKLTKIVITLAQDAKYRYTEFTPSTGSLNPAQAAGDTEITWVGDASSVTFTVGDKATWGEDGADKAGQIRFTSVTVYGEGGGDTPNPGTPNYYKATSVTAGNSYVFVAGGKYNMLFDRSYGYMSTTDLPAGATDSFEGAADAAMKFTAVAGGYNITTTGGKMLGAKEGYKTFDTSDESAANRVWTVSFENGVATITNVATGLVVYQDPAFGSFGCYTAEQLPEGAVKPELFELRGDLPPVIEPTTASFTLVNAIESGADYVMVVTVDGATKIGEAISASATYGRLNLANITVANNAVTTDLNNAITIAAEGNGYTMKDYKGRFLGFDGEHKTSFQLYNEVNEFCVWNIAFTNGQAAITLSAAGVTGQVGVSKGTEGTWYTNIAPSVDAAEIALPALYKKGTSGVEGIVADENAPVEYFNLQGIRVANPENGLYIRRQGNNVSKVYIR
ncbi:MAG: hypothetical protein K2L16_08105 [Muribaculaceae bacterium]|nr:hypothetical protein [Muribaculaceae bacterium]